MDWIELAGGALLRDQVGLRMVAPLVRSRDMELIRARLKVAKTLAKELERGKANR